MKKTLLIAVAAALLATAAFKSAYNYIEHRSPPVTTEWRLSVAANDIGLYGITNPQVIAAYLADSGQKATEILRLFGQHAESSFADPVANLSATLFAHLKLRPIRKPGGSQMILAHGGDTPAVQAFVLGLIEHNRRRQSELWLSAYRSAISFHKDKALTEAMAGNFPHGNLQDTLMQMDRRAESLLLHPGKTSATYPALPLWFFAAIGMFVGIATGAAFHFRSTVWQLLKEDGAVTVESTMPDIDARETVSQRDRWRRDIELELKKQGLIRSDAA